MRTPVFRPLFAVALVTFAARAAAGDEKAARAKSVILLWMSGGPSQCHTFTLHQDGPNKEYEGTPTAVNGVRISEHLPKLAASMKDLALIRTMSTGVNVHSQGHYLMHTGYRQGGTDYPSLGAILAKENGDPAAPLPNYVNLNAGQIGDGINAPGALGPNYAPLMASGEGGVQNLKPADPGRAASRPAPTFWKRWRAGPSSGSTATRSWRTRPATGRPSS